MVEISLLYPGTQPPAYQDLPEATVHDLGLEEVCEQLTSAAAERNIILRTMTKLPSDPEVIRYRCEVFEDVLRFPKMRETMMTLLDRVDFLRTYGSFAKDTDASGVWELVHRLDEMDEYIRQEVLLLEGKDYDAIEKLVGECASRVNNALRHQPFEPGTKEAFNGYVSCLHQLYLMGAAIQLKRMGYHMTKLN